MNNKQYATKGFIKSAVSFLLITGLLAGCATAPAPQAALSQELASDYNYIIGPGDNLNIFVWGNDELTISVPVRPDGKITTRLVEDLPASGKTPTQLARDIEKAYSEFVNSAVVSVIVEGFSGVPSQTVRVVGEASTPISLPFRKHMTLLDLMIDVGGLTEFADGNSSKLIRNIDGKHQTIAVRLDDLLKDGDISANTAIMPGDILIITEAWF
ncbi:MAG: sugar ABC transporter substrate-binding protein [Piscirickettsiaceae bacterium]|nr:MAG: sugar ABC transporter substrate-binding protein [Piscirickettsiaceae bacterium]